MPSPGKSVVDTAFDSFVATDGHGTITGWNPAAERMFGWSRAEIFGHKITDTLIPLRHRESYAAVMQQVLGSTDARGQRVMLDALTRGGDELPVEITLWADRVDGAERCNAFLRDIREHVQADYSRNLMAAVVESSDDAIITKTLDGRITSWNAGAERLLGYTAAEAIGQPVTMLFPPDRIPEEHEILGRLSRGERVEHFETVRLTKSGRALEVALTVSPVRDHVGKIVGASKILRDITARRATERALQEERRLLQLLNDASASMASAVELPALLQAITDAGTQISGAQFGALFYRANPGDGSTQELAAQSGASLEAGQFPTSLPAPVFDGRNVIRVDDLGQDPRSYLAVPMLARTGDLLGSLVFGHAQAGAFNERVEHFVRGLAAHASIAIENARLFDERQNLLESERAARSQAERFNASKDEFLSTLSHELRTPLNNIFGWTQILKSPKASATDAAKAVDIIERNIRLQTQLVDDLLDMSRIVSGQMRIDVQTIMPMSFVKAAVESLIPSADARGVRMITTLDPSAGPVSGDPGRLQQVVWNLISNAIKFTPGGGKIQVTLERVNSHIEIAVADSGIGIKPEFLPQVFKRFTQADSSTTRKYGGLGLGLAIVKHIVDLHGGQVQAASRGENQGTTFQVMLPLVLMHGLAADRRHPRGGGVFSVPTLEANVTGLKVLAVDDEPDSRELIRRVLSDAGITVRVVASAQEALEAIDAWQPDVLVSDIGMPDMDGYELLRRLRASGISGAANVPAIALTAFARSEDRTRAMLAGYLAHVAKPVEPSELIATIASVSGRTGRPT